MNISDTINDPDALILEEGSSSPLVSGVPISELQGLLGIILSVVALLGAVMLVLFIIMAVMRIREHNATMRTQKDIKAIRDLLEKNINNQNSRDKVLLASDSATEKTQLS